MMQTQNINLAFIGFGEAAMAFTAGWGDRTPRNTRAYDIKTASDEKTRLDKLDDYCSAGIAGCETPREAVKECQAVFSLVTADQALKAAQSVAEHLPPDCFYLDCNSCAPGTKKQSALIVNRNGGRYVDVAILAPVHPHLHRARAVISGEAAGDALLFMQQLDMQVRRVDGGIGAASSIKMVRSVMMKGLEAVMAECVLAARKAGVEDEVLQSLERTYPEFDWPERAAYNLERMMVHGARRAAEMREVALTIGHLGLDPAMARATVDWQEKIGALGLDAGPPDYRQRADAVLSALAHENTGRKA